jgi:subtilisin family serine protease
MSEPAPRSVILASSTITQPGELDRLNAFLEKAGLGRPLGSSEQITPEVVALPVTADPRKIVAAVRRAAPEGGHHHLEVSSIYGVDTVKDDARRLELIATEDFKAQGLKSGHGTVTWEPVPPGDMAHPPRWPPSVASRPVVVVLDSGVRPHTWLPPKDANPPFLVDPGSRPSLAVPVRDRALKTGNFSGYWGHATFLAGLIRLAAPDAQVISVRLMSNAGKLDERNLLRALHWLGLYKAGGDVVDVVLMAFGRPKKAGEPDPEKLKKVIANLSGNGVKFVASAGNDHSHTETIPACLPHVVSVGAGTSNKNHEHYSNHGSWVRKWRTGTVVSLMPLVDPGDSRNHGRNGFARWSGTSFSAAIYAGELAQERADERKAGAGS